MLMIRKRAFLVLAVAVLMGTMAVAALADHPDRDLYDPSSSSMPSDVETSETQVEAGDIREPMETGAVPDTRGSSSDIDCCSASDDPKFQPSGGE
jgi:hypothetical protein